MKQLFSGMAIALLLASMLVLAFRIPPARSTSSTIIVPDNYPTIQAAINAANAGDTIYVRAGTYSAFSINRPLTLLGENKYTTVINGGIAVVASSIVICNFTIQHGVPDIYVGNLQPERIVNVTIVDNILKDVSRPEGVVRFIYTSGMVLMGNFINSTSTTAVNFDWANDSIIRNNTIVQSSLGAINGGLPSYNNTFSENTIIGSSNVVYMNGIFRYNRFFHNNFFCSGVSLEAALNPNQWDNGYPSGGNYWSDYMTRYPNATEIGGSGICNTPYVVDANNTDHYPLMNPWTPPDIAVTNVTVPKTIIGQGLNLRMIATATNLGNKVEGFNLTAYLNLTALQINYVLLNGGSSTVIYNNWNSTSFAKGSYELVVKASSPEGEVNVQNNILIVNNILITIKGDVNGDKKVNVLDLILVATHLGTSIGSPQWNANIDLNNDNTINILDLIICANNLGQHW